MSRIGYARVSTDDQTLDLQLDALTMSGCDTVYQETVSGKSKDRLELVHGLKALRAGDVESLSEFPLRGSYPRELVSLGIKEYRQTFFKPYRLIYGVTGRQLIIYLIADGRRDMQSVLARRLLGA